LGKVKVSDKKKPGKQGEFDPFCAYYTCYIAGILVTVPSNCGINKDKLKDCHFFTGRWFDRVPHKEPSGRIGAGVKTDDLFGRTFSKVKFIRKALFSSVFP
jgi:hypothetical protein